MGEKTGRIIRNPLYSLPYKYSSVRSVSLW